MNFIVGLEDKLRKGPNNAPRLRVLITDHVDHLLLDYLRNRLGFDVDEMCDLGREGLLNRICDYDILVVRSRTLVDKEVLSRAANLKIIVRAGSGLDNVDLEEAAARGVKVVNAPEGNVYSVAELTIALMMNAARRISFAHNLVREGDWTKVRGTELYGKTLGIIGFGRIGSMVGRIAKCLGMRVLAYDIRDVSDTARLIDAVVVKDMDELLKKSDVVSLHVPLTRETYHLIGKRELWTMKRGAILVNTARGKVVDTKALLEALEEGIIGAAALDILENEPPKEEWELKLINHPRVIVTPHIGAETDEAQRRICEIVISKLEEALKGL
ncbi:MAG: D-2-hydroxyacid dehydrogenase [Aigarchaeota archaeon]|nr:D-2-hydroxyacid dehydrogenase [Aigarchaeota archaeon]